MIIGSPGFTHRLASKGGIDIVSLGYRIPGAIGPFGSLRVYNDWSPLRKSVEGYAGSAQVAGGRVKA